MTILVSNGLDDNNTLIHGKPICPMCESAGDVFVDKVNADDESQTITFFCAMCASYLGPFNCDVWTGSRQISVLDLNIRVGEKVENA